LFLDSTKVSVTFLSDTEGISLGTCPTCPAETGLVQPGLTIDWFSSDLKLDSDIVSMQSDVSDAPEPSSVELMFAGIAIGAASIFGSRKSRLQRLKRSSGI